jgi:hypothetical protein
MVEYGQSPNMPPIPQMSDIRDIFANFQNNWFHLRYVWWILFGMIFAFWLAKKIKEKVIGDDDDE